LTVDERALPPNPGTKKLVGKHSDSCSSTAAIILAASGVNKNSRLGFAAERLPGHDAARGRCHRARWSRHVVLARRCLDETVAAE